MTDNNAQPTTGLPGLIQELPRLHLMLAGTAVAMVFLGLLLPSGSVQANRHAMPLAIQLSPIQEPRIESLTEDNIADFATADLGQESPWQELTVRKGDSLAKIFQRAGVSATELHEVLESGPEAKSLTRIFPGQKLAFQIDGSGQLQALRYEENLLNTTRYYRGDDNFVVEKVSREPEIRRQFVDGTINSSLYKAASDAGLPDTSILELANIFGGVVDFVLDLRRSDRFTVLYEEHYLDDAKVGNGPILAASFTNQGKTYTAFRYVDTNGDVGYFSPDGVSMRKAFMRAPLDFTRISSGFNPKRLHPILKITRPHRGIDYSAPTGTPVYAAGDGRVVQASSTGPNGNFVVIQHGQQYTTKYLHLQKRGVRAGERVKQGQLIGWVGSTGYATGPHLHYEFLVNGVHRNPSTIVNQLPKAVHLASAERNRFNQQISGLQTQLAAYAKQHRLASAETADNSPSKKL
jgi:murein DD-endopeptidase MepM/ murein hydrolase activator NlpD